MHFETEIPSELLTFTLPLQSELGSVLHFLNKRKGTIRAGLDIGFNHSGVSRTLRELGGYWMTVEMNEGRREIVSRNLEPDTVLSAGRQGELPFEDKQFDVVVVSSCSSGWQRSLRCWRRPSPMIRLSGSTATSSLPPRSWR